MAKKQKQKYPATKLQLVLAQNIKRARKLHGFSQAVLAEKAGVSSAFVGEIEICRKFPSIETLESISIALEVEAFELLMDVSESQNTSFYQLLWKDKLMEKINTAINESIPDYSEKDPEK